MAIQQLGGVVRQLKEESIQEASREPVPANQSSVRHEETSSRQAPTHRHSASAQAYVEAYRQHGYLRAAINPLGNDGAGSRYVPELDPVAYGLRIDDPVTHLVNLGGADLAVGLAELTRMLELRYCGPLALSSAHVRDVRQRSWLYMYMERRAELHAQSGAGSASVLRQLIQAETFERHLKTTYPNIKLFSLEGSESLIPLLCTVLDRAAEHELTDVVIGMPHRGRLNVLANVVGVPLEQLFTLFHGKPHPGLQAWDVKDHLGYTARRATRHGDVNVLMAHNPSHLESVDPVVCGMARALHERRIDGKPRRAMPVLLHGDAAFCAQGIVTETLNLSQTRGYHVGGTLHVIINNQIGSTLSNPRDARSMLHCADVARGVDAPILHVNADDPDAVVFAAQLAMDYRDAFAADVVIDLIGYRRFGHTGHDDPSMTQPAMQRQIRAHGTVVQLYADKLVQRNLLQASVIEDMCAEADAQWAAASESARVAADAIAPAARPAVKPATLHWGSALNTAVPAETLRGLLARLTVTPGNFQPHPHIRQLLSDWSGVLEARDPAVEWRLAENLAYASLLSNGFNVRVTGLDVGRGSFFHRQAVWHNQAAVTDGENTHVPLRYVSANQGAFSVFDTALSEEAVLGFEYGYALQCGRDLVVWEAQFGDFVNNAQVIIDQYIASGEVKWGYSNGLVMFLPHGHDGGGPEHSSGYLGRFLGLCADDNLRVVVPSNSAQLFHLLRRQALVNEKKPLIVMTPKPSVYGQKASHAPWNDLVHGKFETVIADQAGLDPRAVERVVLVSGKLYYDLVRERAQRGLNHVAIVRVEQLFPFPSARLAAELARYPALLDVVWAQEEHKNHGAWYHVRESIEQALPARVSLSYAGRMAAAPSAVCHMEQHLAEQRAVVDLALGR